MNTLRRLATGLAFTLALGTTAAVTAPSAPAAADTWTPPSFVRQIGGHGHPKVWAWGIQWNPVTQELLVSDYWNYKIRRYDIATGQEKGAFFAAANVRHGQPYSIAVDPRDGAIYVGEISNGTYGNDNVEKYDKNGNYLYAMKLGVCYTAWLTVDAQGYLYVSDDHVNCSASANKKVKKYAVNDATKKATLVQSIGTAGSGPGQIGLIHGVDVDSAGNVYAADAYNRVVHKWAANGTWLTDMGAPGVGEGAGKFTGDLRGLQVDEANNAVYVNDSEGSQVEKFALDGTPLANWGSEGTGPGQFADGGRQLTVDGSGDVWVADYGNFRFHRYSHTGNWIGDYPDPAAPAPAGGLSETRDVAVDPLNGSVWATDSWNHRFQRYAADGTPTGTWGTRNSHPPYGMNYPRGAGVDPTNGNLWLADTREHVIRVYDRDANYITTIGTGKESTATGSFSYPLDVEFSNGKAFVTAWSNTTVKVINATTFAEVGKFTAARQAHGVAVDPATGNIIVTTWQTGNINHVYVYSPTYSLIRQFGATGDGDGQFRKPWDVDVINGLLYITDSQTAKVQVLTMDGTFVGKFGTPGFKPGQFNSPSGLTHDSAGNIYIADSDNKRIQVLSLTQPPATDSAVPTVAITSPANNSVVPAAPITVNGTLGDDARVGTPEVAVQDSVTKLWWNSKTSSWESVKTWGLAIPTSPLPTSGTWSFTFSGVVYGDKYLIQARHTDAALKVSPITSVKVTVDTPVVDDTIAPDTVISTPLWDSVVPAGPVNVTGGASDNIGVASVEVAIQDRVSKKWWQPSTGAFVTGQKWNAAGLAAVGSVSTGWSTTFDGTAGSGSYWVTARAKDAAGNLEVDKPTTRFTTG